MSAESPGGGSHTPTGPATPAGEATRCLLTAAGEVISYTGPEPTAAFTSAAAALARDAQRAARHLGLAQWDAMVVESAAGVLSFAPSAPDGSRLAAAAFPAGTPAGAAQRVAVRHVAEGVRR